MREAGGSIPQPLAARAVKVGCVALRCVLSLMVRKAMALVPGFAPTTYMAMAGEGLGAAVVAKHSKSNLDGSHALCRNGGIMWDWKYINV